MWWSKEDQQVKLIGEFERFESGQQPKLVEKARNLMLSYEALDHVRRPWFWSRGRWRAPTWPGIPPPAPSPTMAFDREWKDDSWRRTDATFVLAHAIFGRSEDSVRLLEVKL